MLQRKSIILLLAVATLLLCLTNCVQDNISSTYPYCTYYCEEIDGYLDLREEYFFLGLNRYSEGRTWLDGDTLKLESYSTSSFGDKELIESYTFKIYDDRLELLVDEAYYLYSDLFGTNIGIDHNLIFTQLSQSEKWENEKLLNKLRKEPYYQENGYGFLRFDNTDGFYFTPAGCWVKYAVANGKVILYTNTGVGKYVFDIVDDCLVYNAENEFGTKLGQTDEGNLELEKIFKMGTYDGDVYRHMTDEELYELKEQYSERQRAYREQKRLS